MTVRRRYFSSLTPLELRMMQVLWEVGPASVKVVRQALHPTAALAYTSVQTVLNILQRKGKVKRILRGRAYVYHAVISQREAAAGMLQDIILRMFDGSAEKLMFTLIESNLTDLDRIYELVRRASAHRTDC